MVRRASEYGIFPVRLFTARFLEKKGKPETHEQVSSTKRWRKSGRHRFRVRCGAAGRCARASDRASAQFLEGGEIPERLRDGALEFAEAQIPAHTSKASDVKVCTAAVSSIKKYEED